MKRSYLLLVFCLLAFAIGCGGQPGVRGKVVFSDDKAPLTKGIVNFVNEARIARGQIESDGTYVIGSIKANDGLPPGTYQVYLTNTETTEASAGGLKKEYIIDRKYDNAKTSGITVEVKKSMTFDFEVDRYKK